MIKSDSPKKKHKLKLFAIVLAIVTFIIVCSGIIIAIRWKPILTKTIQNTVLEVSDNLYQVKFADISLNLFTGSVYFKKLEIKADSNVYRGMIKKGIAPENIFNLKIKELTIKNIKPLKVYLKRYLDVKEIRILEPELIITYTRLRNKLNKRIDNRTTYEKIKNTLKSAKLENLKLNEIEFTYIDQSLQKPEITKINRVSINVTDILIDSISQFDSTRIFHSKDINVVLNDFNYPTADSLYFVKIAKLNVSTIKKNVTVEGFKLEPRYGEMQFASFFERQHERYSIRFDSIMLEKIDFPALIDYRTIYASKLTLNEGEIAIFLNRSKPKKLIDKAINYPHVALKRVNWSVYMDTVSIKGTDIKYSEYMANTNSKGIVKFNNLRGNVLRVTNDSSALSKQRYINAYLKTAFLGQADLNIHIKFDMIDPNAAFSYEGNLKNLELHALNPISKALAKVSFAAGKISNLAFSVNGNTAGANGTVKILYDGLRVHLMKKDSENENFKKMGLLSFLANALVIKESNPANNEEPRVSHPYYSRPSDASFFNVMWKVIFLGFKETIGITKEKEGEIKATAEKFKEIQKRREERKLRRKKLKEDSN
ncbi:hypothetical protein Pedsa_3573 [Pseudopedobacter saltans DSM 12145]|uniref:AsmA-like C-terminal domain-containing protein n=1 Tax=Pseudopedobacter saltans (strain ATCC 51119 / DSM 12145 / JCM 21818 / CCUG 39354 / LMG 10337 / NBRC 100064 / NCIMB 13643) TaxID=762903 RepID=F0SF34_PSESL|nr:hypothetical protein [Pseudopedobacter saltans]ADY54102.1 hypothetical protein Pedsa_3573 [Pseudopedobacter saltans DSM 12145]